jgi:hypothetical protein
MAVQHHEYPNTTKLSTCQMVKFYVAFFFLAVLRTSSGRSSITWTTTSTLFCFSYYYYFLFVVLELELRAYTLSYSISLFCVGYF